MRIRIVEESDADEEIVIVCKKRDEKIKRLEWLIDDALGADAEMILTLGDTEHYVKKTSILFFETDSGRVAAHTADKMYYTGLTLGALEATLSAQFVRISKSCIVNVETVCAISKDITGRGEVLFKNTGKKAYVSRGYYKSLKERIYVLKGLQAKR